MIKDKTLKSYMVLHIEEILRKYTIFHTKILIVNNSVLLENRKEYK